MKYPSLTQSFLHVVDNQPNERAQMYRTATGWHAISTREMLRRVAGLSKALTDLGIKAGDRVGIFAPNCPEWHIADFAVQGLGAVSVPIYFNESAERMSYILNDSGARVLVAAGESQVKRTAQCREGLRVLEHVIFAVGPEDSQKELRRNLPSCFFPYEPLIDGAAEAEIADYRRRAAEISADQLATIIYTSGTTGEPKGVMLNHSNLTSNALYAFEDFKFYPSDLALSFLPLAHVYERVMDYAYIFRGIGIAYVERIDTVAQALLEVQPTVSSAVPRFFEKMYANIIEKGHQESGVKRKVFDWAIGVAQEASPWKAFGKYAPTELKMKWWLANRLVYSKIREGLGGRIRHFTSGGAPLATELAAFYWSIGIPVYQGYGLTETSPIVSASLPSANKVGAVGKPIPQVEVKIAADGEILVKGPCVMQGYYHKPDETRRVLSEDGWLCTGDIGRLDEDGYLYITDRKKELLKTAAGKFVAPAPIENLLKTSPYVSNAIVVGDKRKFISALIVPNFGSIEAEARKNGKELATPRQMVGDAWVRDLLAAEIERLTSGLAQYERPKRFAPIEQDFTFANGELTYTLKLKRRVIEERYKDAIARLYADVEEPRPEQAQNKI